jgi:hypothetical protein
MVIKIPLRSRKYQGLFSEIDDEDLEKVNKHKWRAFKNSTQHKDSFYAVTDYYKEDGTRTTITMHQLLLGKKKGHVIDHKNGNGLKNTRDNLRFVTVRQNGQNRHRNEASKYPGVCKHYIAGKWRAQITFNKIMRHIGVFDTEEEAFEAYKKEVYDLTGEELIWEGSK